jgi:hypothetical protein
MNAPTVRFPRVEAVLEAARIADVLRNAAQELDDLATAAPHYELGTLRRKIRGVTLATIHAVVEAEGFES